MVGKILTILIIVMASIILFFFSSCGTTRAVVHNGAHGTSTEIKITTNNPTTVTATPNVSLNHGK